MRLPFVKYALGTELSFEEVASRLKSASDLPDSGTWAESNERLVVVLYKPSFFSSNIFLPFMLIGPDGKSSGLKYRLGFHPLPALLGIPLMLVPWPEELRWVIAAMVAAITLGPFLVMFWATEATLRRRVQTILSADPHDD